MSDTQLRRRGPTRQERQEHMRTYMSAVVQLGHQERERQHQERAQEQDQQQTQTKGQSRRR